MEEWGIPSNNTRLMAIRLGSEEIYVSRQSSSFGESDNICAFSETFSAEHEVVFTNKTHLAGALAAFSAVFSVFSRVSSPE